MMLVDVDTQSCRMTWVTMVCHEKILTKVSPHFGNERRMLTYE